MSIKIGDNTIGGSPVVENTTGNSYTKTMSQATITNELENKADKDLVNTGFITNCITEIPHDIKVEISDNKLVLKAGSKVYIPNGFESDGTTPHFDTIITTSDLSNGYGSNEQYVFYVCNNVTTLGQNAIVSCISGPTDTGTGWHLWYDTTNNKIRRYNNSNVTEDNCSLPVCICNTNDSTTSGVISIDQVFNGFGYIDSTVFVLPDVKVLVPNGRNTDGTLKNIEYTTSNVILSINTNTFTNNPLMLKSDGYMYSLANFLIEDKPSRNPETNKWYSFYSPLDNKIYQSDNGSNWFQSYGCIVGYIGRNSGTINSFNINQTFKALDYNDSSYISQCSMPSEKYIDLTVTSDGQEFIAPANGYYTALLQVNNTSNYIGLMARHTSVNDYYGNFASRQGVSGGLIWCMCPIKKGKKIAIGYYGGTPTLRFIYADGEI